MGETSGARALGCGMAAAAADASQTLREARADPCHRRRRRRAPIARRRTKTSDRVCAD